MCSCMIINLKIGILRNIISVSSKNNFMLIIEYVWNEDTFLFFIVMNSENEMKKTWGS